MTNQIENINQKKICRTCVVIRLFIVAMLLLLIVGILAKDQMHHLSFLTTWNVAIVIMVFGSVSFLVKFLLTMVKNIIRLQSSCYRGWR